MRLLQEQERRQCEDSFTFFFRRAWKVLNPTVKLSAPLYVDYICEWLEEMAAGNVQRLIVNIPPRCAKSTLCAVTFPIWMWLRDPSKRGLFCSHAEALALEHGTMRSRIVNTPWFQRHWGDRFKLTADNANQLKNDKTGHYQAITVSGATGHGGTILVVDDLHSAKGAASDADRERDIRLFDTALLSRLDDPPHAQILVIMQRLHDRDLTGHLLAQGGWTHILLPAVAEEDQMLVFPRTRRVWHRPVGDYLDPNRLGPQELDAIRRSPEHGPM
ncbi:MAG: hypothetical protein ACRD1M_09630, partial [Terriglobales bacterium]